MVPGCGSKSGLAQLLADYLDSVSDAKVRGPLEPLDLALCLMPHTVLLEACFRSQFAIWVNLELSLQINIHHLKLHAACANVSVAIFCYVVATGNNLGIIVARNLLSLSTIDNSDAVEVCVYPYFNLVCVTVDQTKCYSWQHTKL